MFTQVVSCAHHKLQHNTADEPYYVNEITAGCLLNSSTRPRVGEVSKNTWAWPENFNIRVNRVTVALTETVM